MSNTDFDPGAFLNAPPPSSPSNAGFDPNKFLTGTKTGVLEDVQKIPGQVSGEVSRLTGHAQDIDYQSGAPFSTRTMLSRAENPKEAQKVMERTYGAGNYGQDEGGRWWGLQDGKKVAVYPGGFFGGLENTVAGMAGAASPMAGAIAGGSYGTMVGGPFGAAVGAGLGAAAGWGMDQLVKYYQGLYDQTPAEAVNHAKNEATINAALTGAAPVVQSVGKSAAQGLRNFLGVTPTTAAMTNRLVAEGTRPPIETVAPEFHSWADKQVLRNAIAGDPWEETNAAYVRDRFGDALKSSGMNDAAVTSFMKESSDPLSAITTRPTGEMLSRFVQSKVGDYQATVIDAQNAARSQLRKLETAVNAWANQPVGRLGQDVADAIINQRRQFSNVAQQAYGAIDKMTGEAPVFPMGPTVNAAKQWVDLAEPGLVPPYVTRLASRDPNVPTTFAEAHEIRTNLRELLGGTDLTRTPYMHKIDDVASAVDGTFKNLEAQPNLPGQAAQALRNMDKMYAQGIAKFYNGQINQLVRSTKSGLIPNPEVVAGTVIRDGRTEAAQQILKMVPPDVRDNIFKADMRSVIADSSRRGADGNNYLDGMAFLDQLEKREAIYKNYYNPSALDQMKQLGRQLAALDGKIDVSTLPPSQVTTAISHYVNMTRQIDQFVKANPIGALASGTPEVIDRAAARFAQPGDEATTEAAMNFFGPASKEWQGVQKQAQAQLIKNSLVETAARNPTVSGEAIERALAKYTPKQQEMLFPGGMADDLKEVAKEARFLFPPRYGTSGSDMASGMAAKSITLHTGINLFNPRTAYADARWMYTSLMGWVTDRPGILKFLAGSARSDPSNTRRLLGALSRWIINGQIMGPGSAKLHQPGPTQQALAP